MYCYVYDCFVEVIIIWLVSFIGCVIFSFNFVIVYVGNNLFNFIDLSGKCFWCVVGVIIGVVVEVVVMIVVEG